MRAIYWIKRDLKITALNDAQFDIPNYNQIRLYFCMNVDRKTHKMTDAFGIGLTRKDFEVVGKLTVTASILDHEIGRATLAVQSGPQAAIDDKKLENQMKSTVWKTFGQRLRDFIDAYKK